MEGLSSSSTRSKFRTPPWSNSEHRRFLVALEKYGGGTTGAEWQLMADFVGPARTADDLREHAHKYFLKLQGESTNNSLLEGGHGSLDDGTWTVDQDAAFEGALAAHDEAATDRWEKVAAMVPGKAPDDVRLRYQKLLYDVARIEHGERVTTRHLVRERSGFGTGAAAGGGSEFLAGAGASAGSVSGTKKGSRGGGSARQKRKRALKVNVNAPPGYSIVKPVSDAPAVPSPAKAGRR